MSPQPSSVPAMTEITDQQHAEFAKQVAQAIEGSEEALQALTALFKRLQQQVDDLQAFVLDQERRLAEARVIKTGTSPARTFPPDEYELLLPPMGPAPATQ